MPDYHSNTPHWNTVRSFIFSVIIENGIGSIGAQSVFGFIN